MRKFTLITVPTITLVGFAVYYILGGHKEIIFEVTDRPISYTIGNYFEGRPADPALEKLFVTTRDQAKEMEVPLVVINYELDTPKNKIRQFIGTLHESKIEGQEDLMSMEIPAGNYLQTEIHAHNLVMPNPRDIREAANEFATFKGVEINNKVSYEIYEGDDRLIVLYKTNP